MITKEYYQNLGLKKGDHIWIMNEKGEGFWGNFVEGKSTERFFLFNNHSNGKTEEIEVEKLQQLQLH